VLGLTLVVLAALEPAWGRIQQEVERRGVELVVCLDTSRSMLASDLPPDRLSRAKKDIRALLPRLSGDRIGLVAFAGDARVVCPLTHDFGAFEGLLDAVDTRTTRLGGTDLGAALRAALALLPREGAPSQAIVILTDGEDLAGQGAAEADRARARGVRVHAIGYGSVEGAKIPGRESGEVMRDENGQIVVSRLDAQGLRQLTGAAAGTYLGGNDVSLPLVELFDKRVRPMQQRSFEREERSTRQARYQWALIPGFVLLLLAWLQRQRVVRPSA
jgi:Ca-activated chloride channel family protein